ncbi:MAG: V-type ATP synthase subunit E [Bacillota bacterium]|jgi:vacuolar-type H+-ATPase subunit E/Vma4
MPLEEILKKIGDQSAQEASAILGEAREKAQRLVRDATEKAQATAAKLLEDAKTVTGRQMDIAMARAETERRQAVLQEKQNLVKETFDRALARLVAMPKDEYRTLLAGAIVRSSEGAEEVILGSGDEEKLGPDFPDLVKAGLKAQGKSDSIRFRYDNGLSGGGFILKHGGISLNVTFPAVLQRLSDELEIEAARILFQEQGRPL